MHMILRIGLPNTQIYENNIDELIIDDNANYII